VGREERRVAGVRADHLIRLLGERRGRGGLHRPAAAGGIEVQGRQLRGCALGCRGEDGKGVPWWEIGTQPNTDSSFLPPTSPPPPSLSARIQSELVQQ